MNLKKMLKRWYYRFRNSDPVKNCPVYLSEGCSHVDGLICPFPNCPVVSEYLGESFISCTGCAYQDSCSSEQFGLGCYKGCKIPEEEASQHVKDSKKYKVLFADLDGTLIDTISGETFPKGIWDMKFRLEVLDKIKELNPNVVYIPYIPAPSHLEITSNAYIGLLFYEPADLNRAFCAPNKIYEYSSFGLPIIGNNIPGLRNTIGTARAGVCVDINKENIISAIKYINSHYEEMQDAAFDFYENTDNFKTIKRIIKENNIEIQ